MAVVDLCFYSGIVSADSHASAPGIPERSTSDEDPRHYFGLQIIGAIRRDFPELPIVILSSMARVDVSLEFSRLGVLAFIPRTGPGGPELMREAVFHHALLADPAGEVVGQSLPMLLALREARRAAGHRENVLIRGERGSGKDLLAHYVHRCAQDAGHAEPKAPLSEDSKLNTKKPSRFIAVNSASFSPNLFATELFGIQPRTNSGVDGKIGLIEMAKGGELFLDEIADMPPEVQAALMRVLQERQVTRVGSRESIAVDVRFLSATNADLEDDEHSLRPDLLDRLRTGGTIWIPPLRERREDIPLMAENFIREAEAQRPGIQARRITPEALDRLMGHDWPGNVRELRGVIFDAVTRHPDVEHLVTDHLRIESKAKGRGSKAVPGSVSTRGETFTADRESLDLLLDRIRSQTFDPLKVADWAGRLPDLQREPSHLVARLLGAALEATKRRTPGNPDGILQIHPAAKLATGDSSLTAVKAADLFKRLLAPIQDELEGNLLEAYQTSIRLRPKSPSRANS
jgi:DNA-binding NtrC family response regulator